MRSANLVRQDLWLATNRISLADDTCSLRFHRSSMAIELAMRGGGLARKSVGLCLSELQRGELVPFSTAVPVIDFIHDNFGGSCLKFRPALPV